MQSLENVSSSLAEDRKRVARSGFGPRSVTLNLADEEDGPEEHEQRSARKAFQTSIQRLMAVNWFTERPGVKHVHVAARTRLLFETGPSEHEKAMLGSVLSSYALMSKSTELLQSFQHELHGIHGFLDELGVSATQAPQTPGAVGRRENYAGGNLDSSRILALAVKAVHKAKWFALRTCWKEFMQKQDEDLTMLRKHHGELQEQFEETRLEYLREVAALRDQIRVRSDFEFEIDRKGGDVVYFYDPAKALSAKESEYVLHTLKEKLQMLLERSADNGVSIDLGQLQKLQEMKEHKEVVELKRFVAKQSNELKDIKRLVATMKQDSGDTGPASRKRKEIQEQIILDLEDKVTDLRSDLFRSQDELKKTRSEATRREEGLRADLTELEGGLRDMQGEQQSLYTQIQAQSRQLEQAQQHQGEQSFQESKLLAELKASRQTNQGLRQIVRRVRLAHGASAMKMLTAAEKQMFSLVDSLEPDSLPPTPVTQKKIVNSSPHAAGNNAARQETLELKVESTRSLNSFDDADSTDAVDTEPKTESLSSTKEGLLALLEESHDQLEEVFRDREELLQRMQELERENHELREGMRKQSQKVLYFEAQNSFEVHQQLGNYIDLLCGRVKGKAADAVGLGKDEAGTGSPDDPLSMPRTLSEVDLDLQTASKEADAALEAASEGLQQSADRSLNSTDADLLKELQEKNMLCQRRKMDLEVQSLALRIQDATAKWQSSQEELRGSEYQGEHSEPKGPCNCRAAQILRELEGFVPNLLTLLGQVGQKMQSQIAENMQLHEALLSVSDGLHQATSAMESSPEVRGNKVLQRCLTRMKSLRQEEMPSVFQRLYRGGTTKSFRRAAQIEKERKAEFLRSAVIFISRGKPREELATSRTEPDVEPPTQPPPIRTTSYSLPATAAVASRRFSRGRLKAAAKDSEQDSPKLPTPRDGGALNLDPKVSTTTATVIDANADFLQQGFMHPRAPSKRTSLTALQPPNHARTLQLSPDPTLTVQDFSLQDLEAPPSRRSLSPVAVEGRSPSKAKKRDSLRTASKTVNSLGSEDAVDRSFDVSPRLKLSSQQLQLPDATSARIRRRHTETSSLAPVLPPAQKSPARRASLQLNLS
eukprot:TRINITY_DN33060_c0_g1_i1.p1 TRINITY_DN33060_c0_g1~~TRINITY_DN33060_c0_g1_i1.p1  ORF type:complete len:1109 (-),score=223.88 TRINITY_DN33060_c0_g1_i1:35-3361(-)